MYDLGSGDRHRRHCGGSAGCAEAVKETNWFAGTEVALYDQVKRHIKAVQHEARLGIHGQICALKQCGADSDPGWEDRAVFRHERHVICILRSWKVCGARYIL